MRRNPSFLLNAISLHKKTQAAKCKDVYAASSASLTRAGHGARVVLGAVVSSLADALDGLFLGGRAVRRTFGAVGVRGRGFVGTRSARCREKKRELVKK